MEYQDYGQRPTYDEVMSNADRLRIMYSDRSKIRSVIPEYDKWLNGFHEVFILGFGFDDFNLRKLELDKTLTRPQLRVFATLLTDIDYVKRKTKDQFRMKYLKKDTSITFEECNCSGILEKHLMAQ